jgi:hypothetical protein
VQDRVQSFRTNFSASAHKLPQSDLLGGTLRGIGFSIVCSRDMCSPDQGQLFGKVQGLGLAPQEVSQKSGSCEMNPWNSKIF